ncbi:hypothetical protein Y1Q_0013514 [Alligator mississippiensis]|uniref:Uncharacterized protein n=1 Tax=Alligator mississippiensis TaxID=8496 RepID=A0A151P305_ALLMI|nr:hypothetical protein Y1Q_0013514 [Alligator mississippiensis]
MDTHQLILSCPGCVPYSHDGARKGLARPALSFWAGLLLPLLDPTAPPGLLAAALTLGSRINCTPAEDNDKRLTDSP